tara:strand:- start:253 stop:1260 length:1008 start_codon:yes stop_codon:yes gene_type:complete
MKKLLSTCVLSAAIGLTVSQGASAKETIVLGELNWEGAVAIEHVLKVVMEENFDVDVEIIAADQAAIWSAMDSGKGSIDVFPDIWTTLQSEAWSKFVVEGSRESVKVNKIPYLGDNGFYIPGYIQDEYGVKSVYDLAKPEVAALFDGDGDGLGEYWVGASGWELVQTNQIKAKSYGFSELYTPTVFSSAIMQAQLKKAYRKKEGMLFYYWTPAWIHYAYDLRKLEEPEFTGYSNIDKKTNQDYNPDGCYDFQDTDNWLADSEITCAYPIVPVHIGYTASLEDRAPEVAEFLSNVVIDGSVVSKWIFALSTGDETAPEIAKKWVNENPDIINSWLQ